VKSPRILLFSGFALSLVAAAAAGLFYGRSTIQPPPAAPATVAKDDHGAEAAEVSDLDRPVDELFSGKCEHDLPHYTCDECRYELGVVKLDGDVVSKEGKPGLVNAIPAGTASFEGSVRLTGEVHISDSRTVHVSSPLSGVVLSSPALAGQKVAAGDVLFVIDSHEISEAKSDLLM